MDDMSTIIPGPEGHPLVIGPRRGRWEMKLPGRWASAVSGVPLGLAWSLAFLEQDLVPRIGVAALNRSIAGLATFGFAITAANFARMYRAGMSGEATWRIDDAGAGFHPPKGEPQFLAWDDVEAVRLRPPAIGLRGRGVRVMLPARMSDAERDDATRRIKARLGVGFDLAPRPLPRISIGNILRLLGLGLLWTAASIATMFGPLLIQDFGGPRIAWMGRLAFIAWMTALGVLCLLEMRKADEEAWLPRRVGPPPAPG